MTTFVALLRGINVSGQKKVPMAELRALAEELRYAAIQTYIQSGNLVFSCAETAAASESRLEQAIAARFGFPVDVMVRSAAQWPTYVKGNPFLEASQAEPNLVMMSLAKRPVAANAVDVLRSRAQAGERIEVIGEAIWVHYASGVARSKLSPTIFDRAAGSPVTARNWRTVQKLAELLSPP